MSMCRNDRPVVSCHCLTDVQSVDTLQPHEDKLSTRSVHMVCSHINEKEA